MIIDFEHKWKKIGRKLIGMEINGNLPDDIVCFKLAMAIAANEATKNIVNNFEFIFFSWEFQIEAVQSIQIFKLNFDALSPSIYTKKYDANCDKNEILSKEFRAKWIFGQNSILIKHTNRIEFKQQRRKRFFLNRFSLEYSIEESDGQWNSNWL